MRKLGVKLGLEVRLVVVDDDAVEQEDEDRSWRWRELSLRQRKQRGSW